MRTLLKSFFFSFILLFIFNDGAKAQKASKRYVIKVTMVDDHIQKGTFADVNEKGVYIASGRRQIGDTLAFVPVAQIREIKLRRKGKVGTGSTIGFFTGLAVGVAGNVALHSDEKRDNAMLVVGAAVLTFATSAIGGAMSSDYDHVIQIFGRAEDFKNQLSRLKSFIPANEPLH